LRIDKEAELLKLLRLRYGWQTFFGDLSVARHSNSANGWND
jgi:hypothetical protein